MPVHDWTRVDAGTFHDFHNSWITHLKEALNEGLLPEGFYALSEQHAGRYITDVLTLHPTAAPDGLPPVASSGGVALAEAPPKVRRRLTVSPNYRTLRRTLAIRHVSGHRIIALVEIVSPSNKDRQEHVDEFVDKLSDALRHGVHLVLIDLFPPRANDPQGMHGALWRRLSEENDEEATDEPLTLASHLATSPVEAFIEHLTVEQELTPMPLFLASDRYVNLPLEETYHQAWRGMPSWWKGVLEGGERGASS